MPLSFSPNVYKGIELQKQDDQLPSQKISPLYKMFSLAGQGADLTSTLAALNNGFHESNPIMPQSPIGQSAIKAGAMVLTFEALKHLEKNHPQAAKALALATGMGGMIPAAINTYRMTK